MSSTVLPLVIAFLVTAGVGSIGIWLLAGCGTRLQTRLHDLAKDPTCFRSSAGFASSSSAGYCPEICRHSSGGTCRRRQRQSQRWSGNSSSLRTAKAESKVSWP